MTNRKSFSDWADEWRMTDQKPLRPLEIDHEGPRPNQRPRSGVDTSADIKPVDWTPPDDWGDPLEISRSMDKQGRVIERVYYPERRSVVKYGSGVIPPSGKPNPPQKQAIGVEYYAIGRWLMAKWTPPVEWGLPIHEVYHPNGPGLPYMTMRFNNGVRVKRLFV